MNLPKTIYKDIVELADKQNAIAISWDRLTQLLEEKDKKISELESSLAERKNVN